MSRNKRGGRFLGASYNGSTTISNPAQRVERGDSFRVIMHYVYLLKSVKDNKWYIGCTSNLRRRFREHSTGAVKATAHRRLLELCYYEAYVTKKQAEERERKLKQFGSAYKVLIERI